MKEGHEVRQHGYTKHIVLDDAVFSWNGHLDRSLEL